jgi:integrase/recombinase XerC
MARLKPPIVPDKPVPVVPEDALRRLLAACAGKSFEARRDTALITFLLDTGARRGEVADLRLTDLDFDLDVALVLGKGRRWRSRSARSPGVGSRPAARHGGPWPGRRSYRFPPCRRPP